MSYIISNLICGLHPHLDRTLVLLIFSNQATVELVFDSPDPFIGFLKKPDLLRGLLNIIHGNRNA